MGSRLREKLDFDRTAATSGHESDSGPQSASQLVGEPAPMRISAPGARPPRRSPGPRETLALAFRQFLHRDLSRERHARLITVQRQHGAGVACAQLAALELRLHPCWQTAT